QLFPSAFNPAPYNARAVKVAPIREAVSAFGRVQRAFLRSLPGEASGQLVVAAEVVPAGVQGRSFAVPGHADIGKVPIHATRRQYKGPVHGDALRLVEGDGIAVVNVAILVG